MGRAVDAPSPSFLAVHPSLPIVYAVAERAETVAAYRRPAASAASATSAASAASAGSTILGSTTPEPAIPGSAMTAPDGAPQLEPFGEPWPAGAAVCHVAVDPRGQFLTATCWGDGRVLLYELAPDGAIVSRHEAQAATDPHAAEAAAGSEADTAAMLLRTGFAPRTSRAHCSLILPDARIMTTDLGYDLVRVWNFVPGTGLTLDHELTLPFWSGPRHLISHPNGSVLVITEYSVDVVVLTPRPAAATAPTSPASPSFEVTEVARTPTSAEPPAFDVAQNGRTATASGLPPFEVAQITSATLRGPRTLDAGAELALSADGRFVYATVRSSNTVSTLRVDARGHVHALADHPSGGDWPRHHLVQGLSLLIAHERSSQITLFALHPTSGLPTGPLKTLAVEAPTALIPA
ncbi:beta-propeller fold lactonase family protein [Subtercola sp. YIM 133946]